jgi:hypothetical protein
MSRALGYRFSDEELRRGIYYPKGHEARKQAHLAILNGLSRVLRGDDALRMKITEAPGSEVAAKLQTQLTEKMATAYGEDGALRIRILPEAGSRDRAEPRRK